MIPAMTSGPKDNNSGSTLAKIVDFKTFTHKPTVVAEEPITASAVNPEDTPPTVSEYEKALLEGTTGKDCSSTEGLKSAQADTFNSFLSTKEAIEKEAASSDKLTTASLGKADASKGDPNVPNMSYDAAGGVNSTDVSAVDKQTGGVLGATGALVGGSAAVVDKTTKAVIAPTGGVIGVAGNIIDKTSGMVFNAAGQVASVGGNLMGGALKVVSSVVGGVAGVTGNVLGVAGSLLGQTTGVLFDSASTMIASGSGLASKIMSGTMSVASTLAQGVIGSATKVLVGTPAANPAVLTNATDDMMLQDQQNQLLNTEFSGTKFSEAYDTDGNLLNNLNVPAANSSSLSDLVKDKKAQDYFNKAWGSNDTALISKTLKASQSLGMLDSLNIKDKIMTAASSGDHAKVQVAMEALGDDPSSLPSKDQLVNISTKAATNRFMSAKNMKGVIGSSGVDESDVLKDKSSDMGELVDLNTASNLMNKVGGSSLVKKLLGESKTALLSNMKGQMDASDKVTATINDIKKNQNNQAVTEMAMKQVKSMNKVNKSLNGDETVSSTQNIGEVLKDVSTPPQDLNVIEAALDSVGNADSDTSDIIGATIAVGKSNVANSGSNEGNSVGTAVKLINNSVASAAKSVRDNIGSIIGGTITKPSKPSVIEDKLNGKMKISMSLPDKARRFNDVNSSKLDMVA